jgi:hypothetical protein
MTKDLIELTVFDTARTVGINWAYALEICADLDKPAKEESGTRIKGKAAIKILAEYAATAHRCAWPPPSCGLIIVVCPPSVWFCPNDKQLHGLFVEPYDLEKHGAGLQITNKTDLFDFCSISARLDGWRFSSEMVFSESKACD